MSKPIKVFTEERDYVGYIGVCYAEHCNKDAVDIVVHHHHKGFDCDIQKTDEKHCEMFFCEEHSEIAARGEEVAVKPEIVDRHEG